MDDLKDRSAEFEASGYFRKPALRRYQWDITFDADEYVALLRTTAWYRRLDDDVRAKLFQRVHDRIRAQPGQTITPTMAAVLYVAEWT